MEMILYLKTSQRITTFTNYDTNVILIVDNTDYTFIDAYLLYSSERRSRRYVEQDDEEGFPRGW